MESWRKAWRQGFAPGLNDDQLVALAKGLLEDDEKLIQGATCTPPPIQAVQDWPLEAGDPLVYAAWQAHGSEIDTVGPGEEFFALACFDCDQRLKEPAGCRWFINAWDETPRNEARRLLFWEVNYEIVSRCDASIKPSGHVWEAIKQKPEDTFNWLALADQYEEKGTESDAATAACFRGWVRNDIKVERPTK